MSSSAPRQTALAIPIALATLLLVVGLAGGLTAAWGYGLFLVATVLILAGVAVFAVFMLSHRFDSEALRGSYAWLFRLGGWSYVLAVAAFAGFFGRETLAGRMELKWILFGPAVLAAIVVLDLGLYRLLVKKNLPTWQRYGHLISREQSDPEAMRRALIDEVLLHRTLFSVSRFRWLRHTLIYWGFAAMFAIEVVAVFVREAMPAFSLADVWRAPNHPIRLAFDVAFDVTGLMMLTGCLLALGWRIAVNGTAEQKFADTPTAVFLLFVVVSGFVVEGMRLAAAPDPAQAASFVGVVFAAAIPSALAASAVAHDVLWLVHVLGSCAFIAYVPVKRLVHSCATPMGRLMNSQKGLLAAKKQASLEGLLAGKRVF
jgi:nitrate reductase gamma subunit